jgi:hypothetical protein
MADFISEEELGEFIEDIDSSLYAESEEIGSEEDFIIDDTVKHWEVDRESFLQVLEAVMIVPIKSSPFIALKLVEQDGMYNLQIHSDNKETHVDCELPVLNENPHVTKKVFFLNCKNLHSFVRSYTRFVFIFDDQDRIYYKSSYAEYLLDSYRLNLDDMLLKEDFRSFEYTEFPLSKNDLHTIGQLFSFAVKDTDVSVLLSPNGVDLFLSLYKYSIQEPIDLNENVILRKLDINIYRFVQNGDLFWCVQNNRLFFKWRHGYISTSRVPYKKEKFNYPVSFATGASQGSFHIDVKVTRKSLKLVNFLRHNTVLLSSVEGKIQLAPTDSLKFTEIGAGELSTEVSLLADILSKILTTVPSDSSMLRVVVAEGGVDLISTGDRRFVYSLSRVSASQFQRKEKCVKKQEQRAVRISNKEAKGQLKQNAAENMTTGSMADAYNASVSLE